MRQTLLLIMYMNDVWYLYRGTQNHIIMRIRVLFKAVMVNLDSLTVTFA